MKLPEAYRRVAQRSVEAARTGLEASLPEIAGFHSSHAVEAIGAALCTSQKVRCDTLSLRAKLNLFVYVSNRGPFPRSVGRDVAITVQLVASLRDDLLYPHPDPNGGVQLPEEVMDQSDARDLLMQVERLARTVEDLL